MTTIMIYSKSAKFDGKSIVSFQYPGKRIPREKLNEMFANAAKQLNVPESELVYERF